MLYYIGDVSHLVVLCWVELHCANALLSRSDYVGTSSTVRNELSALSCTVLRSLLQSITQGAALNYWFLFPPAVSALHYPSLLLSLSPSLQYHTKVY
jgi:hypothetical protein